MISLQDLTHDLQALYPSQGINDPSLNGLQIEGVREIRKIATGVSADLETIEQAHRWGADALIVHHGLFWEGQQAPLQGSMRKKVALLIENNINLFAFHLPMDLHQEVGNNWNAARDLGLQEVTPYLQWGVRGVIAPTPIDNWVEQVGDYYGSQMRCALGGPEQVTSVAILSGAGNRFLSVVESSCYITGNCDEKQWRDAHEKGIHFLSAGHHNTEKVGPKALAHYLAHRYQVEVTFLDLFNPF
ncbi:MAG: Nif3-like dinuclear metal center hexameric protein [Verrucomicrobia bacterium]|nr:Nif3-like dinuclear metal center hexameric protein [Verrucomicrobiota bacterium]